MAETPTPSSVSATCPSGCGCRRGTNDPDRLDCACDGPCCFDEDWDQPFCDGGDHHDYQLSHRSEDVHVYTCIVCGDVDARPPW